MRVVVVLYARLADLAGHKEWHVTVADDATASDVWDAALAAYPALSLLSGRVSCAVNAEFARMDARVRDGDEVAFLPPVSGGRE